MEEIDFAKESTQKLLSRLEYLLSQAVPKNKDRIMSARRAGDFSDGSEYDLAKREQYEIHCEIMVIVSRNSMISCYFDTISMILCQIFYKNLD